MVICHHDFHPNVTNPSTYICLFILFDAWKKVKHVLPNGGLMLMNPMVQKKKHLSLQVILL